MELSHSLALIVRRISVVLGVLALIASFGIQAKSASAATQAFVRVVHASPDIGTADVFLEGTKLLSNFAFGTVTGYATIPPGPHKVQAALIGKGGRCSRHYPDALRPAWSGVHRSRPGHERDWFFARSLRRE